MIEYLYFLYPIGHKTLLKDIYIGQAGQILEYCDGCFSVRDYFIYDLEPEHHLEEGELLDNLWQTSKSVFKDVVSWINNKTVVIPLSSGFDSRFIASMLKLFKVKDVICVCYGLKDNYEAKISRKVAEKLGFEWCFVEYSYDRWLNILKSNKLIDYFKKVLPLYTTLNIQEYLMIMEFLKDEFSKSKSYVFIPGDSGDFLSGSHITGETASVQTLEDVIYAISKNVWLHFREWPPPRLVLSELRSYVTSLVRRSPKLAALPRYKFVEAFDWREKQAKFIASTRMIYAHFNQKFIIPLWDKRFAWFWSTVPLEYKYNKTLYHKFLYSYIFGPLGVDFSRGNSPLTMKNYIKQVKLISLIGNVLRKIRTSLGKKISYDPCGFHTYFPLTKKIFSKLLKKEYRYLENIKRKFGLREPVNPWAYMAEAQILVLLQILNTVL